MFVSIVLSGYVNGNLIISLSTRDLARFRYISIYNLQGQLVYNGILNQPVTRIPLSSVTRFVIVKILDPGSGLYENHKVVLLEAVN